VTTLEERVAFLEGKVEEHSRGLDGMHEAIVHLEQRMDRRFEAVDLRFEAVDRRFEAVDRRFEGLERRLDALDRKLDQGIGALDHRIDALDEKLSRHFTWLVGAHIMTLMAIVTALAGAFLAR
jgi:hypothetical protein